VASHLIRKWNEQGRHITLISRRGPENDFYSLPGGLPRRNLGGEGPSANKLTALLKNVPYIFRLRRAIKSSEATVVLSFLTKANIHTILACIGLEKKVVISERNDTTRQNYPWPWPLLRKWVYRFADIVTANSEIALAGMREYVPKQKLVLVHNPVEIPESTAEPEKSKVILNVGRLVPQKAQHLLLEAFSRLDDRLKKEWSVEFLGDGPELTRLKEVARESAISGQVKFRGLVKNPSESYKRAAIFVLCSEYEGTSNALLEAMSFGLPPVVSDSLPGAVEQIEHGKNGLIFHFGEPEDLAVRLKRLLEAPQLRSEMGLKARRKVQTYSVDKVIQDWNQILDGNL
jgi:glycosyltransferase involved in cell wall biosynthesis